MRVLHPERQIKAQCLTQLRDLARRGAFAEHQLDGIAGVAHELNTPSIGSTVSFR